VKPDESNKLTVERFGRTFPACIQPLTKFRSL
jgi:hypothetical protein